MFDYREYYKDENEIIKSDYEKSLQLINEIIQNTVDDNNYNKYFNKVGKYIIKLAKLEEELCEDYFKQKSFEELKSINESLYVGLLPNNYNTDYNNPAYAVQVFGEEIGQILSYLSSRVQEYIQFAYQHKVFEMNRTNKLFIDIYNYITKTDNVDATKLKNIITKDAKENVDLSTKMYINELCNAERSYLRDMVAQEDLTDFRYLFKYGKYIGDNEIKIAEYLNTLPENKIILMANIMTEGYRMGFIRDNKDITIKSTVSLRYQIGFERVMKVVIENFEKLNLKSLISIETTTNIEYAHTFTKMFSTNPNKQYSYDHRYDYALYYDKEYVALKEQAFEKYVKVYADKLKAQGGPALLEVFGEKPFSPKTTVQNLSLDDKQTSLNKSSQIAIQKIINPYLSREEYSFTIVSYPIPEIGEQFEEIFDATIEVNTLDANMYERIQQTIIDALDEGEYVHVKGKGSNKTDIMVNLYELNDREKETRFHNCLADVNIPVGEVYTSPVLTGTNGTLFVKEVYLKGLKYENLEIVFKDGYIDSYTCSNFDVEEENKKFVYENLMLPHKTLPLGEFAIGTNTTAYVMANKYNILDILPILITEKMGPHFAIGDTCFLWSEDVPVYNSNGKEVIARDNEKSILRKTNIEEAYTGLHTDITIPYNELDSIDIVLKNGDKIGIINNGRFVLEGTQELNKALDKLD
ncbi:MAG: aminopeptidase [Vallitalea sp.]|jgi:uncharacterized protein (DUF736 family)|nr:aminopeptidase [Vallitalea sp.]